MNEVDFEHEQNVATARGMKYGAYIQDVEESLAEGDMAQVAKDVAKLRRYHDRVIAARKALSAN